MSKSRVYELAKQYNTTSKMIMEILGRNDITTKNHMSNVDADGQKVLERVFSVKPKEVSQQKVSAKAPEPKDDKPKEARPQVHKKPTQDTGDRSNTREGAQSSFRGRDKGVGQRTETRQGEQQPSRDRQEFQKRPAGNQQYNRPQGSKPAFSQQGGAGQSGPRGPRPQFGQDRRPSNPNQQNQQRQGGQDAQQPRGQWQNRPNQGQQNRPNQGQGQQNRPNQGQGQQNRPNQGQQNRFNQGQGQQNRFGQKPATGNFERKDNRVGSSSPSSPSSTRTGGFSGGASQGKPPAKRGDFQQSSNKPGQNRQNQKPAQLKKEDWNMGKNSRSETGRMRQRQQSKNQRPGPAQTNEAQKPTVIQLGESIIVKDLAVKLGREVGEVIKKLMLLGIMATINQEVDFDTASLIAAEFEVEVTELPKEEDPTEIEEIEDDEKDLVYRSPVVTVMGHVDHGKTSLLDAIRQTNVISQEAGGITQHIGAYQVMCNNKKIVFLDTPGHEAFTAMRARGAQVTDIAILVVAADDGVMPQTIEAINHAKSAKVPIIVAINKMDREGANPDRVKQQLSENGLIPEDWGGDTVMVPVSAHQKTGINDLLEMVLLVAEMLDLKANPNRRAYGTVIEAKLDKNRGPVTTLLVQKGTLRVGDPVIAGAVFGRVRAMVNDRGEKIKKAEPSTPVEILGLTEVPLAGDVVVSVDEKVARAVSEKRTIKKRTEELKQSHKVSLDDLFKQIQEGQIKDLNIVLKADVQGSIEALKQSLQGIKNSEVRVNIVHAGVGAINESDVMLATASNAFIIGYNVRPDANSRKAAENEKIDIRTYRVIYEAINDVEAAITGMLSPEYKEVLYGQAEIRQLISVPKTVVAGCYVTEGKVTNNSQIRVIRNGIVVHEGNIESLRRFKDDVKEVNQGYECGISLEGYRDIKEGDILESFGMEEVKKKNG